MHRVSGPDRSCVSELHLLDVLKLPSLVHLYETTGTDPSSRALGFPLLHDVCRSCRAANQRHTKLLAALRCDTEALEDDLPRFITGLGGSNFETIDHNRASIAGPLMRNIALS